MLTDVQAYCVTFLTKTISTTTYRCSYLPKNGGSKVVHLIYINELIPRGRISLLFVELV